MDIHMEGPMGAKTIFNGCEFDYFSGTGYLGLQSHPLVIQAAMEAMQQYGLTTATSRGGYGEHPLYDRLEKEICTYFGAEKALYFASGYMGMAILTQTFSERFDHIFIDQSAHYSLWDAAQGTNKMVTPFHHCSPYHLDRCLRTQLHIGERPLVLTDGLFPVSGELAPIAEYLTLVKPHHGKVYVDDAHAVGVLGENGRGTAEYFSIEDEECRTTGTLSKALGGFGGIIFGKADYIRMMERNARFLVGASPPPLVMAAASAQALALAGSMPQLRIDLKANITRARDGLRSLGWELEDIPSPIICLSSREGIRLQQIRLALYSQGIAVTHVRSYSSTPAEGCLRIAIFATHTSSQIDRLVDAMGKIVKTPKKRY